MVDGIGPGILTISRCGVHGILIFLEATHLKPKNIPPLLLTSLNATSFPSFLSRFQPGVKFRRTTGLVSKHSYSNVARLRERPSDPSSVIHPRPPFYRLIVFFLRAGSRVGRIQRLLLFSENAFCLFYRLPALILFCFYVWGT